MRATAALPRMQARAESRMLDTFDINVSTGLAYDEEAGEDVEQFETLFSTPGRVKVSNGLSVHDSEVGGRTAAEVTRTLHIPVNSDLVPTGAIAICTAVHVTSDPTLLGAALRIGGPAPGSQTTARRLEVTEVLT